MLNYYFELYILDYSRAVIMLYKNSDNSNINVWKVLDITSLNLLITFNEACHITMCRDLYSSKLRLSDLDGIEIDFFQNQTQRLIATSANEFLLSSTC